MGCVFFWLAMICVPIILIVLCFFFGALFGALTAALFATFLLHVLSENGFFDQYKNSETAWKRYGAAVLRVIFIVVMIIAWTLTIMLGGFLIYKISGV